MDGKFHPAIEAMRAGDVEKLKALAAADQSLATSRSSKSHPTLLQAVVLDGKDKPKLSGFASKSFMPQKGTKSSNRFC